METLFSVKRLIIIRKNKRLDEQFDFRSARVPSKQMST